MAACDRVARLYYTRKGRAEAETRMRRKNLEVIARVRRTEEHRARLITMLRDSATALGSVGMQQSFYSTFGISDEVVLLKVGASRGNRPGTRRGEMDENPTACVTCALYIVCTLFTHGSRFHCSFHDCLVITFDAILY